MHHAPHKNHKSRRRPEPAGLVSELRSFAKRKVLGRLGMDETQFTHTPISQAPISHWPGHGTSHGDTIVTSETRS